MNGKTAKRWPQRRAGTRCLLLPTQPVTENDGAPSMIFSCRPQPDGGLWQDLPDNLNHAIRTLQQQGALAARLKPYRVP